MNEDGYEPACCLCRVLGLLPIPLPGMKTPQELQPLLAWAAQLMMSPRVRESDAGEQLGHTLGTAVPL
jgi:hypothetical protein